jgi:hypothetical protein
MSPTKAAKPAKAAKAAKPANDGDADEALKRLGGGRWQTRDERFTIEPQSGTWAVVDAEATDDLGLPLVRGPFRSLTDAKAAIAAARTSDAPASPLAERLERGRTAPTAETKPEPNGKGTKRASSSAPAPAAEPDAKVASPSKSGRAKSGPSGDSAMKPPRPAIDEPPSEPSWFRELNPPDRGRARRLIDRLTSDGAGDAESIVRRDLAGGVPAVAAHTIATRLAALPADTPPTRVAELLAEGRDEALGIRWRLVDGEGRPIVIERKGSRRGQEL